MMKSTEFIKENTVQEIQQYYKLSDEFVKLGLAIKKKCQPYLKENPDPLRRYQLYRGVGGILNTGKGPAIIHKQVKLTNRKPKDTPIDLHSDLNYFFEINFGIKFRNSLFATGHSITAGEYGSIYVIFPAGQYKYIWSPEIDDIWKIYDAFDEEYAMGNGREYIDDDEFYNIFLDEYIVNAKWKTTDLPQAIESGHEIMIHCKEYYGIRLDTLNENNNHIALYKLIYET